MEMTKNIYFCQSCPPDLITTSNSPLLRIPLRKNQREIKGYNVNVKGCVMKYPLKQERVIPLYGYKCCECKAKKQLLYYKCTECEQVRNVWCQDCVIEGEPDRMKAGHAVILENNPFSFWDEQMSESEFPEWKNVNSKYFQTNRNAL